jgi:hypothetical protein
MVEGGSSRSATPANIKLIAIRAFVRSFVYENVSASSSDFSFLKKEKKKEITAEKFI